MGDRHRGTEIFTSYQKAAEAVRSGDETKIRDLQKSFQNLSPEEQETLQALINEVIETSETPTKEHLATLRETMLMYEGLGVAKEGVTSSGRKYISRETVSETLSSSLFGLGSLTEIGISQEKAKKLAEEIIGAPLDQGSIKAYQKQQRLEADGVIGKETYVEMYASQVDQKLQKEIVGKNSISPELQKEILFVTEHGNIKGKNYQQILFQVKLFRSNNQSKETFNTLYKDFYKKFDALIKNTAESEAGVQTRVEAQENIASIYKTFTDDTIPWNEKILKIGKDPVVLMSFGVLFLFGVVGGDTKYTDSFMKRIGWLVGGVMFGPALWKKLGGDEALRDLGNYMSSPEFKSGMDKGKAWFQDTWTTMTSSETYDIGVEKAKEVFGNTLTSMTSLNETFRESEAGKYIEHFTGKSGTILADKSFLNTTKERVLAIKTMADLKIVMSPNKYAELEKLKMTDIEVQSFIENHMKPQLQNIKDDELVRKSIWYEYARSALEGITFNEKNPLNSNPKINAFLTGEIANIINGRGSETYKLAARKLAASLQDGQLKSFNIDEEFASLSPEEKSKLDTFLVKIKAILEIQTYIADQTQQIQTIEVKTEGIADTKETLEQDMKDLNTLKVDFEIDTILLGYSTLQASDFDVSGFEAAYTAKRLEILRYAQTLGMTTIGGVTIADELTKQEAESKKLADIARIEAIRVKLSTPPDITASLKDFEIYYSSNKAEIEELEVFQTKYDGGDAAILAKADTAYDTVIDFGLNYIERRKQYSDSIGALSERIKALDPQMTYAEKRMALQTIAHEHSELLGTITKSRWTARELSNWVGISWNAYVHNAYKVPAQNNILDILDAGLKLSHEPVIVDTVQASIQEKISEIETLYPLNLPTISDTLPEPEIAAFVKKYTDTKREIKTFGDEERKTEKLKELDRILGAVVVQFTTAIQSSPDIESAQKYFQTYKLHLADIVTSSILDESEKERVGNVILEKKRESILEKRINSNEVGEIFDAVVKFFKDNADDQKLLDIYQIFKDATDTGNPPTVGEVIIILEGVINIDKVKDNAEDQKLLDIYQIFKDATDTGNPPTVGDVIIILEGVINIDKVKKFIAELNILIDSLI